MVFIQIGGSDLVCSTPNIHFAQYLLDGCGVKYVIIGQVLRRDPRRSTATFNDDVVNFYISLASACANHLGISYWKHRGFWASMDFLATDGVHIRADLNGRYLGKYLQSIKSANLHVFASF